MTNDNDTKKQLARAKRSDLDAMQDRFDAIIQVVTAADTTACASTVEDVLALIRRLASGDNLDSIIREAGIRALGLEQ